MSGGSYDYMYLKIGDLANEIQTRQCPHRMAFRELLVKVAKAMHDIEWVDSGDYGDGDELDSIKACFDKPETADAQAKIAAFDSLQELMDNLRVD